MLALSPERISEVYSVNKIHNLLKFIHDEIEKENK